jgi:hypothetical protein
MPRPIRMKPFRSTSIAAAGYDGGRKVLRLRYVGGHIYDYRKVPRDVFDAFLSASSKGRFVNWHIKPRYPYERVR